MLLATRPDSVCISVTGWLGFGMTPNKTRLSAEAIHDRRTELVKTMVAKENAAMDSKTARLKALRLAKEAEDKAAAPPAPKPAKPRRRKS